MILDDVFSADEAHYKALKVKRLQSRTLPFRHPTPIEKLTSDARIQMSFTTVDRPPARQSTNTSTSVPAPTTAAAAKRKENPYAKLGVGECYRRGEPRHRSS